MGHLHLRLRLLRFLFSHVKAKISPICLTKIDIKKISTACSSLAKKTCFGKYHTIYRPSFVMQLYVQHIHGRLGFSKSVSFAQIPMNPGLDAILGWTVANPLRIVEKQIGTNNKNVKFIPNKGGTAFNKESYITHDDGVRICGALHR